MEIKLQNKIIIFEFLHFYQFLNAPKTIKISIRPKTKQNKL